MSMAVSQRWDANLLSHSLEFNHKTIFSLAFVFNLDIIKCLDVYPKPIKSDLSPQTTSLCTTGLAPPPEGRPSKSCLFSHIHHLISNAWCRLSLPCQACLPHRFLCDMEKSLCISGGVSPRVHFGSVGSVEGAAQGTGTGRQRPWCSEHALLMLQEGSVRFKICFCQKLPVQTKANPVM